jgi:hypothetical protein
MRSNACSRAFLSAAKNGDLAALDRSVVRKRTTDGIRSKIGNTWFLFEWNGHKDAAGPYSNGHMPQNVAFETLLTRRS